MEKILRILTWQLPGRSGVLASPAHENDRSAFCRCIDTCVAILWDMNPAKRDGGSPAHLPDPQRGGILPLNPRKTSPGVMLQRSPRFGNCRALQSGSQGPEGGTMRSELVTGALQHVPNRFLLTRVAAKAIRAFHRPNSRIADTTNDVLRRFSTRNPIALRPTSSSLTRPELRRAS